MAALAWWAAPRKLDLVWQVLLVLGLVVPLGPIVYRVAFQPLANASVLVLFIVSMAVHYVLRAWAWCSSAARACARRPFRTRLQARRGGGQARRAWWSVVASVLVMVLLWLFFERTVYGKALRATAINRVGARLVGIPPGSPAA